MCVKYWVIYTQFLHVAGLVCMAWKWGKEGKHGEWLDLHYRQIIPSWANFISLTVYKQTDRSSVQNRYLLIIVHLDKQDR